MSPIPMICDQATIDLIASRMQEAEDEAIVLIDEALMAWPQDARLYLLRGSIRAQQGSVSDARTDFGQAVILDPVLYAARFMLGHLELTSSRTEQAVAIWMPLTALENHAIGHFARGMIELVAGRANESLTEWRLGLDLSSPEDALALFFRHAVADIERTMSSAPLAAVSEHDDGERHYLLAEYLSSRTQH